MIKLLAVDMDETAVNSRHRMTKVTREALREAYAKGVQVVPVTGRCLEGLPMQMRGMEELSYIITSNGAKVYDWKGKEVLYRKLISNETACDVLKICQEDHMRFAIHQEGKCYDNSKVQAVYRKLMYHGDFKAHKSVKDLLTFVKESQKPVEKIQIFSGKQERLYAIQKRLEAFEDLELAVSTSGYIEVTQKDAQKGKALEYLCNYLGIGMEEVMAIGDNVNDYSMLAQAGYSVAMGNANEEIKHIAKYVTASNDEDGVARVIYEKIL